MTVTLIIHYVTSSSPGSYLSCYICHDEKIGVERIFKLQVLSESSNDWLWTRITVGVGSVPMVLIIVVVSIASHRNSYANPKPIKMWRVDAICINICKTIEWSSICPICTFQISAAFSFSREFLFQNYASTVIWISLLRSWSRIDCNQLVRWIETPSSLCRQLWCVKKLTEIQLIAGTSNHRRMRKLANSNLRNKLSNSTVDNQRMYFVLFINSTSTGF